MKAYKILHLSLAFTALVAFAAGLLALFIWQRQDTIELALRARERHAAEEEIRAALDSLETQMLDTGQKLAQWDETRQQLVHSGYYTVWRDTRVRDSGQLQEGIERVGLYDKSGTILMPDASPYPLPGRIKPPSEPRFTFHSRDGRAYAELVLPVHADPAGKVLLGYLGLKTPLFESIQRMIHFRFIDSNTLSLDDGDIVQTSTRSLANQIRYEFRPNPYLDLFREVFRDALWQLMIFIGLSVAGAAFLLHRVLVRPLEALSREIDSMRQADSPPAAHPVATLPIFELENVRDSFRKYHTRLMTLHADLEKIAGEFRDQAVHDALTGVYNRRAFDSDRHEMDRSVRPSRFALLLYDCDNFKEINDRYGHDTGDAVLRDIANCLQKALRAEDKLYRLGGDEFAALLPDADSSSALAVARRCRQLIQHHDFGASGITEPISLSIGIALAESDQPDIETLQKQADMAMYAAKQPDSGKIVFYKDLAVKTA